jgi:hypothetical protein
LVSILKDAFPPYGLISMPKMYLKPDDHLYYVGTHLWKGFEDKVMIPPKIGKLVGYPMTPIIFVIFLGHPLSYAYAPITLR